MITYKVYQYICENGYIIKALIPDTVTEDDLKGFREIADLILKRTYKVQKEES